MATPLAPAPRRSVLIVGGYGVVGAQIAALLHQRNPELELWIGGRSEEKASALAAGIDGARAVRIDVAESDPLAALPRQPDAVLAVANDPENHLLLAAARRGIPYVDITRWTERMHAAILRLAPLQLTAPVVLASGWMAGVAATVAAHRGIGLARIDSIDIDILYALKDKAGPNSLEYADRLNIPFAVREGGRTRMVKPLTDPRAVAFSSGQVLETYRFDTPDQYSLAQALDAPNVSSRLSYDDPAAVKLLRLLLRSGIWHVLSWRMLDGVRHSLLYNPGDGDRHEVMVEVTGSNANGKAFRGKTSIVDPLGQTHMTAAGAVVQVERVLGLRERAMPAAGVSFPEHAEDLAEGIAALCEMGITLSECA